MSPTRVVVDDDEQQLADLEKAFRRLRARLATTHVRGTHDEFTVAATPQTTFQLTYIPVDGTCAMYKNGLEQREGTDYTVNYDVTSATVGLVTFVTALTAGQKVDFRYLITDWLVARSLPTEGIVPATIGDTGGIVNNGTTVSSNNSFTPAANTLILVAAEWNEPSATTTTGISDTIGGLTWTEITNGWHSMTSGGSTRYAKTSVFWAVTGSSPPNGKITITSSAACAISFKPFTIPDANTASPLGNHGFANVTADSTAPASVTASATDSGASLVVAVLGIGGVTTDPSAPADDSHFTNLYFYGGGTPVRTYLDISYSRSSHSATWIPASWGSQFQYYDAIVLEING